MSSSFLRPLFFIFFHTPFLLQPQKSESKLSHGYYSTSCPQFYQTIQDTIVENRFRIPTAAPASIRLLLHDCFVDGCDASILLSSSSSPSSPTERESEINLSLAGDGFDLITIAKYKLEILCPHTVSCADILVALTHGLLTVIGGPTYDIRFGRKDSLTSNASLVHGNIPLPTMSTDEIISIFESKHFTVDEMVVLSGAHTLGLSHCKEFAKEIYNYSSRVQWDPTYNHRFSQSLRNACSNYTRDPTLSIPNDIITPNVFDNQYFKNLPNGLGLLSSDRGLHLNSRTKPFVDMYAEDENAFFTKFGEAMGKLSVVGVKEGVSGEVRRRCDVVNPV